MKVGDYVRTDKGIAKYLGLGRDVLKHETNKNTYEHYYNQHLFDNYIFNVGHDYGDTLTYDEFNNIDKLGKVKETITDLIEVGDYVNGIRVHEIEREEDGTMIKIGNLTQFIIKDKEDLKHTGGIDGNNDRVFPVKSIVTHEQFSQMEYRIGE